MGICPPPYKMVVIIHELVRFRSGVRQLWRHIDNHTGRIVEEILNWSSHPASPPALSLTGREGIKGSKRGETRVAMVSGSMTLCSLQNSTFFLHRDRLKDT